MTIPAGEFKAKCLKLMDRVNKTHEIVTITKRGKPVAQLVSVSAEKNGKAFGSLRGCVAFEEDIVSPLNETWHADG